MNAGIIRRLLPGIMVCLVNTSPVRAGGYELRDTTAFVNDIYKGRHTSLFFDSVLIDTIETGFGLQYVGADSVLYIRVETIDKDQLLGTYFTKLVLCHRKAKVIISDSLPVYNEHFSSPGVVDSCLYYWGLTMENVYAVKVTFPGFRSDSIPLELGGSVITDSPDYFRRPHAGAAGVLFAVKGGQVFVVQRDMRVVRELTPPDGGEK